MKKVILVSLVMILAGCVAQSTPERHTRHYVTNNLDSLNPQYKIDVYGSIQSLLPAFQEAYNSGLQYKKDGKTEDQALTHSNYLRDPANYSPEITSTFTNNTSSVSTDTLEAKQLKAYATELAATFLDGYYQR